MNTQKLSPQGYNINRDPMNKNPFWETDSGGNVPAGGTAGQVLTKRTDADFDTEWKTPEAGGGGGLPGGGLPGDLLTKTETGAQWVTPDFASSEDVEHVQEAAESAQTAADAASAAVTSEQQARERADAALGARIDEAEQELNDYKDVTNQAIEDLRAADSAEATAREESDTALGSRIDAVASDLQHYETATDAELQAQDQEDQRLDSLITDEATARMDADTLIRQDLSEDIRDETQQREAADNALRALIADNSGDIEVQEGAISALNTRVTKTESDIAGMTESVEKAAEDASDALLAAQQASSDAAAAKAAGLPSKTYITGDVTTQLPPSAEDAPTSGATPSDNVFFYLYGRKFQSKIIVSWAAADYIPLRSPEIDAGIAKQPLIRIAAKNIQNGLQQVWNCYAPFVTRYAKSHDGCLYIPTGDGNPETVISKPIKGGTTGQILTKFSDTDYDWMWADPPAIGGGLPEGGNIGDIIKLTDMGAQWAAPDYASADDFDALTDDVEALQQTCTDLAKTDLVESLVQGSFQPVLFMGLPWMYFGEDGAPHARVNVSSPYEAPDSWAEHYTGGGGEYGLGPVYFPNSGHNGALTLTNTTYGDEQGRLYVTVSSDITSAVARSFTLQGDEGSSVFIKATIKGRSDNNTDITFVGSAIIPVKCSATAAESASIGRGSFSVNNGFNTWQRADDDFLVAITNEGGIYAADLAITNNFIYYVNQLNPTNPPMRFRITEFNLEKFSGRISS